MSLFLNQKITKSNYINIIFSLIPISFIAGNMVININIALLLLSVIFLYGKTVFKIKYYFLDKLIILFFSLVLFTGFFNDIYFYITDAWPNTRTFGIHTALKSIFYLRFLILYLVIRFLIENQILNLKNFFISCSFCSIFVCLDLYYQLNFGQDIFGYKAVEDRVAGPFGDELIAGGYIQRFSIFSFFLIPIFFKTNIKKILKFLIPVLFILFFSGIIISVNRMPLVLFLFLIFLITIFEKKTRKYLLPFLIIFPIIFLVIFKFNTKVQNNFHSFYNQIYGMSQIVIDKDFNKKNAPQYFKEFSTFYDTWLLNKYIGGGIKNFRYYCHKRDNIDRSSKFICNMHPHNYYLEILTDTGLIGFFMMSLIFLIVLYISFFKKYFTNSPLKYNHLITPFMFLFITEIFPIRSTGSFFTTGNTTYLFLIMAITVAFSRQQNTS